MAWDYAIDGAQTAGIAAPTGGAQVGTDAKTMKATNLQGVTGAGGWFDASKWDPNNFMAGLNTLSGLQYTPPSKVEQMVLDSQGYHSSNVASSVPGYVTSSNGTPLLLTKNADGSLTFKDSYDDPGGKSNRDQMDVTYKYDPKTGVATPISANSRYQPGDWVSQGQPVAQWAGSLAAMYGAAAALPEAGAGTGAITADGVAGTGAAGGSAATGNMALIDSGLGTAGYGGSSAGTIALGDGAGSVAAAGGAGAASGGTGGATAATGTTPATNSVLADSAMSSPGYGASSAGGGLNATQAVTGSSAFAEAAKSAGQSVMDFAKTPAGMKLIGAGVAALASSGGGGGAAQDASNATSSQSSIAQNLPKIGTDQLAWNKQVYADGQATRDAATANSLDAAQTQLATAKSQSAVAGDYDAYNKATLRPLEQKIAADAMGYDTAGRRADAIAGATSDVEQAYAGSNAANQRALQRSGVTTGSGRMQALMADQAIAKANSVAGASTTAVRNVENTGATRMADAAKMLNYLPAAQTAAANSSTAAGTAASGSGATAVATQGAGVTNVNTGYTGAINASKAAGDLFGQAASESNKVAAGDAATNAAIGNAIGTYLGSSSGQQTVGDIANWISDEKKKKGTGKPGNRMQALAQVNKTPVDDGWSYDASKGGPADSGKKHTGPMAQAVRRTMGEKVAPGGKEISPMDMNGKMMLAVQALSAKVDKLERRAA